MKTSASAHPSSPGVAGGDPFIAGARHRGQGQHRNCFYCWEGRVFLGRTEWDELEGDAVEVYTSLTCLKCDGTGVLAYE